MTDTTVSGRVLRIGLAGFLLLLSITALALNCRLFLAQAYARYANEFLKNDYVGEGALVATDWAIRLMPFAVQPHVTRAALLVRKGEFPAALDESRRALKYGGYDPFIWQTHAQLKLQLNEMDDELTEALAQAGRLAPSSYWLHERNARFGLAFWAWGTPEQRERWVHSIDFVLATDSRGFLQRVLDTRRQEVFCHALHSSISGFEPWCQGALMARQVCFTVPINPDVRAWCRRNGLAADSLDG